MIRIHLLLLWVATCAALSSTHAADAPALPAVESFYRNPDVASATLSPSGGLLAVTSRMKDRRVGLVVLDLQRKGAGKVVAHYSDIDVNSVAWRGDDQLVFDTIDLSRGIGEQGRWRGLVAVSVDGSATRELVQKDFYIGPLAPRTEGVDASHGVLQIPITGSDVIVGRWTFNARREATHTVPFRLDIATSRVRAIGVGAPDYVKTWLFDPHGEPRVAIAEHEGRGSFHWKGPKSDTWKELSRHPVYEAPYWPAFVDADGRLYVTVNEGPAGTSVLRRFDLDTGAPAADALVRATGFDVHPRPVFDDAGRLLGVRVDTDAETTVWFDTRLAQMQKDVDARLPGKVNRLSCRRCAAEDPVVLVHSWSDRDPGRYALYDPQRKQLEPIASARPDIDPRRMATLDFHRIRTRDGRDMPLWLTLPPAAAKAPPRPAVVLVHGGPWVKGGEWQWEADAQFLASRGYVVIEPEFRGSTGYGRSWFRAGWKQWGQAMQDDIADATKWAIAQGHADPARICIAGASYGGYSTLMGLARDADLYRCGIAWVAVTDPRLMADWSRSDWSEEFRSHGMPQLIGDVEKDAAMLAAAAPVELAGRIKAPVMLGFGGQDGRVQPVHATRMRSALRAAGNDPEWTEYADEGHGWLKEANRSDWARRMETFLAKHLK